MLERPHRTGRRSRLDRQALLDRLPPIQLDPADDDRIEMPSLARMLLTLVEVDQETEFALCERVVRHLLGTRPDGTMTHGR